MMLFDLMNTLEYIFTLEIIWQPMPQKVFMQTTSNVNFR